MSSIKAVTPNIQSNSLQRQKMRNVNPSFGENPAGLADDVLESLSKDVAKKMDGRLGLPGKLYKKLSDTSGEIQNQSINALFTSTLAPLFIAFNPFSKQDEKTKKYTALRQPISAVISLTGGMAMTMGINSYMDKIYNEGSIKSIDLRSKPSEAYLRSQFKKENKIWSPFLNSAQKAQLKDYVKKTQDNRQELFARLITEDPKLNGKSRITVDEATKSILIDGKAIFLKDKTGKEIGEEIGKNIPNLGTQSELDAFLKDHNLHNKTFGEFLKEEFHIEFFEDGSIKPEIGSSKLSQTKLVNVLHAMGLVEKDKINPDDLVKAVIEYCELKEANQQCENLIKQNKVADFEEILRQLKASGKVTSRIIQAVSGEEAGKTHAMSLGQFFHHLGYRFKDQDGKNTLQKLMDTKMVNVLDDFKNKFKNKLKNFDDKADFVKLGKNMLKNAAKIMETHSKNYQTIAGIFFNLFTTAITCTILNWSYPRIVEAFWPHLVKADNKGGNK